MDVTIDIIEWQHAIAIDRNEKAYGKLFIHYYKLLTRFSLSIVKSEEAAEEIYGDVMMKIWRLGAALDKIENLHMYLFISVKNASLNYLSSNNKFKVVDIDSIDIDLVQTGRTFEDDFMETEFKRIVASSVAVLPPKCRMVYQLIRVYGFNYKQVAQIMDISVNTVEGHMTTALKKITFSLRHYLQPDNN